MTEVTSPPTQSRPKDDRDRAGPDTPARRRQPLWRRKPEWLLSPLVAIALLGFWAFAVDFWQISYFVIPPPGRVFDELWRGFTSGIFVDHMLFTTRTAVYGFVAGVISGIVVGGFMATWRLLDRVMHPYVVAFQAFPKVAIIPVLTIWFGFGMTPKVLIAAILAFFPIMVNTHSGLLSVKEEELELMRSLRASPLQIFWKLRLPTAVPYILAGVELAMVLALLGAITAEFLGSNQGLGYLIQLKGVGLEVDAIFALLIVFGVLGMVVYAIVHWLRDKLVYWQ